MKTSIVTRPSIQLPIQLRPRDCKILDAVYRYRYLSCEHIHGLFFRSSTERSVQIRLRKLWLNHYLDRHIIPAPVFNINDSGAGRLRPLYTVAFKGASLLSEMTGTPAKKIPSTAVQNADGFCTLEHHLIAIDLLVGVESAVKSIPDIELTCLETEAMLRKKLSKWRETNKSGKSIVSDGAFTIRYKTGETITYHIEVVRSDVKGGNENLFIKFIKYTRLLRKDFFKEAYGHNSIRVLVATTSEKRAETFRSLAERLKGSRHLFLFGVFEIQNPKTHPTAMFTIKSVLSSVWRTVGGQNLSLVESPLNPSPNQSNKNKNKSYDNRKTKSS